MYVLDDWMARQERMELEWYGMEILGSPGCNLLL